MVDKRYAIRKFYVREKLVIALKSQRTLLCGRLFTMP
jgi:hypothetical protein